MARLFNPLDNLIATTPLSQGHSAIVSLMELGVQARWAISGHG